jgi:hypothetical protein
VGWVWHAWAAAAALPAPLLAAASALLRCAQSPAVPVLDWLSQDGRFLPPSTPINTDPVGHGLRHPAQPSSLGTLPSASAYIVWHHLAARNAGLSNLQPLGKYLSVLLRTQNGCHQVWLWCHGMCVQPQCQSARVRLGDVRGRAQQPMMLSLRPRLKTQVSMDVQELCKELVLSRCSSSIPPRPHSVSVNSSVMTTDQSL